MNLFGFFGIINHDTESTDGKTIYDYSTRSEIEQYINMIKNELSFHDNVVFSEKIQIILVSLIIYYRLNKAAKIVYKIVMEVARYLKRIKAEYYNSSYVCVEKIPSYLEKILEFFGGDKSIFYTYVQDFNYRIKHYIKFHRRRKTGFKPIYSRVQRDENGNTVPSKRGRIGDLEKTKQRAEAKARRQYDENDQFLPLPHEMISIAEKRKNYANYKR